MYFRNYFVRNMWLNKCLKSFRGRFDKQHFKRAQILLKSEAQHPEHIY